MVIFGHYFALDTISMKKGKDSTIFFYDSYGRNEKELSRYKSLTNRLKHYAKRIKVEYNQVCHQKKNEMNCAHYTIFYLLLRCRGYDFKKINMHWEINIPSMITKMM